MVSQQIPSLHVRNIRLGHRCIYLYGIHSLKLIIKRTSYLVDVVSFSVGIGCPLGFHAFVGARCGRFSKTRVDVHLAGAAPSLEKCKTTITRRYLRCHSRRYRLHGACLKNTHSFSGHVCSDVFDEISSSPNGYAGKRF